MSPYFHNHPTCPCEACVKERAGSGDGTPGPAREAALREALEWIATVEPEGSLYHGGETYYALNNRIRERARAVLASSDSGGPREAQKEWDDPDKHLAEADHFGYTPDPWASEIIRLRLEVSRLRAELGRAPNGIGPGHWTIPDDVRGKAFTDWRDANAEWEPDESSYFVAGMEFGIEWALRARADAERPNSIDLHLDPDGVSTDPWQSGPCGTGYLVWQEYPTASEARQVAVRLNAAERPSQETTDG